MSLINEADITINGVKLTSGQAMTIRVALQSFAVDLLSNGLGGDDTGEKIKDAYLARMREINAIIHDPYKELSK